MATSTSPSLTTESPQPLPLPQWQYDAFCKAMENWKESHAEDGGQMPAVLACYIDDSKTAFHLQGFCTVMLEFCGWNFPDPFDGLTWVRENAPTIVHRQKDLMLARENDFDGHKFPNRTTMMDVKNFNKALYGLHVLIPDRTYSNSNCLIRHLNALDICMRDGNLSKWEWHYDACKTLCSILLDTAEGLSALLERHDKSDYTDVQATIDTPGAGRTTNEQGGLRRRRLDVQSESPSPERATQPLDQEPRDHTPVEATLLLAKAIRISFLQIPFAELIEALWRDSRAPVSLSLIFTSISSVLIGIALTKHNGGRPRIDDGFFQLLSNTIIQLFSLYVLLLPFLRRQEPYLQGVWFCLSIGASVVFSVVACIVYAFSWRASAVLSFGGTLASMIASLLLVQGIDKGKTEKETENTNGRV